MSDQDLLAVLLGSGTLGVDVMTLAPRLARLIDDKGLDITADDLTQLDGVGDAKATLILAAIEFTRRRIKPEGPKIETPTDLLPHLQHFADRKQEHFLCATINGANEILKIRVVSIGLVDRNWQRTKTLGSPSRCGGWFTAVNSCCSTRAVGETWQRSIPAN